MKNSALFITFLTIFSISMSAHSYTQQSISSLDKKLPPSKHHQVKNNIIYLNQYNSNRSCPSGFVWDRKNFNSIENLVRKTSFDPSCIWGTIDMNARDYVDKKVQGFSFGTVMEASLFIGANIGTELVVMPWDHETLMVGMVRLKGGSISASLSGGSRTQSVIYGQCENAIFGYTGLFQSKAAVAMMENTGVYRFFGERTGCNSISSIRGSTSPIVGVAMTIYEPLGNFVMVQGPGVRPMLDYFKSLNHEK